jgi:CBS domain-containing protein
MPVGDYCQRDVRTIDARETLRAAALRMAEEGVGSLVVLQGRQPRGILTDRDVALRVLRDGLDADAVSVLEAVGRDPIVMHETSPLRAAAALMRRCAVRRIPIVDAQEQLVGVIAFDDVLRLLARELSGLAEAVASQAPSGAAPVDPAAGPEVE